MAAELVGCMVSTVLYRWQRGMGDEAFLAHVLAVQGQADVPLDALRLPVHPESQTPLTPVMVDWIELRAFQAMAARAPHPNPPLFC